MRIEGSLREFLDAPRFAVLGTVNDDGSPHLTVIWYELVGDEVLFNTRRKRVKDTNLRRDPRVSLCVEDGYRFASLAGRVVGAIEDQAIARADILRLGIRYGGPAEAERQWRALWSSQIRVSYRMAVERVHARGFDLSSAG